jgi:hypothetical protein
LDDDSEVPCIRLDPSVWISEHVSDALDVTVFVTKPRPDGREHLAGDLIRRSGSDEGSYPASRRSDGLAAGADTVEPCKSPSYSSESARSIKLQRVIAELQQACGYHWIAGGQRPKRVQEQKGRLVIAIDRATEGAKNFRENLLLGCEEERPIHDLACERADLSCLGSILDGAKEHQSVPPNRFSGRRVHDQNGIVPRDARQRDT